MTLAVNSFLHGFCSVAQMIMRTRTYDISSYSVSSDPVS